MVEELWILRWSSDAWGFRNGEVSLGNQSTHLLVHHALIGNLWHSQACGRCQRDVQDVVFPPFEELNSVSQERRDRGETS